MRLVVVACLALCACSRLFGLDDIGNDDKDGDHVPDAIDNCPNDYNPDQSDFDGNGIGDRCDFCGAASGGLDDDDDGDGIPNECDACDNRLPDDNHDGVPDACEQLNDGGVQVINPVDGGCPMCEPCSKGVAHDEDGDLIADACDPCAIDPATMVADLDADGVGDTCDASTDRPSHQLFDPFATPNQDWYQIGSGSWNINHDVMHINGGATTQIRVLGTGVGHFVLRTKLSGVAGTNNDTTISLVAARPSFEAPVESVRCSVVFPLATGAPELQIEHDEQSFPTYTANLPLGVTGSGKYTLALDYNSGALTCEVLVGPSTMIQRLVAPINGTAPPAGSFSAGVSARGGSSTFEYYQLATDN
jgi:hypothetical protein